MRTFNSHYHQLLNEAKNSNKLCTKAAKVTINSNDSTAGLNFVISIGISPWSRLG